MKSPAIGPPDDQQPDNNGPARFRRASRPNVKRPEAVPGARPSLQRAAPERLAEISQSREPQTKERQEDVYKAIMTNMPGNEPEPGITGRLPGKASMLLSEEDKLIRLRNEIDAKIIAQQQQRKRAAFTSPALSSTGIKRVSPITEEGGLVISPSLVAAFSSPDERTVPPTNLSTASSDSVRTVRASVPATPSDVRPVRTPSYPFPFVPRSSSTGISQSFMTLSPTVTRLDLGGRQSSTGWTSSEVRSDISTPVADTTSFLPPGTAYQSQEDPRYPTPNLYNLVLNLSTEPGMDQWWTAVVNIMHAHFMAERVTLIMPLDSSDLENVPWGQKATFSMNGPEEFVPHGTVMEQALFASRPRSPLEFPVKDSAIDRNESNLQSVHPERHRPRLETRHSYAGHGREDRDSPSEQQSRSQVRPSGPKRVATYDPESSSTLPAVRLTSQRTKSTNTVRHSSVSDPDFSTVAGVDTGPHAAVFSTLRPLDHEIHPLIEPYGVNRILERGRLVTVTRDYVSDESGSSNDTHSSQDAASTPGSTRKFVGNHRYAFAKDHSNQVRGYEETEQCMTSPWAQSPAPSPALQADEDDNPFFATEQEEVEDSFSPKSTPRDYSQLGQVAAIGVDRASTVIHLPLIHPTLSKPMQTLSMRPRSDGEGGLPQKCYTLDAERKAPIAILSILNPAVPYPHNLAQVLKLLGPHLATSFAIAQQYSSAHQQAVSIRYRQPTAGTQLPIGLMTIEPTSLEEIVNVELERPAGSRSVGSMTSPSDYSGRSRHSPSGSIVGTPGWDPASHGWSSAKSQSNTPYTGAETGDNYFDAKKLRSNSQRISGGVSASAHMNSPRSTKHMPVQEATSIRKPSPPSDEHVAKWLVENRTGRLQPSVRQETLSSYKTASRNSLSMNLQSAPSTATLGHAGQEAMSSKQHSVLHSYGADWNTSFGTLASNQGIDPTTSGSTHARKSSYSEDMPPPSERLLRTIIDSVPVQIFTAKPDSGQLSWVNTKYLVYRGQEAHQALEEPWSSIHPEDREEFTSSWYRSLRTAQQLQQKVRLQRFDGSFRWFYVRAAPLKDKRQKIVHWIGTMMDFHEQHIAELNASRQQETAASEAKYRALANSSPQIVFAVSRERGVIFCNSQWFHYAGQSEASALGVGFMDHVHPDDISKCRLPAFENDSRRPTNVPTSMPVEHRRSSRSGDTAMSPGSAHGGDKEVNISEGASPVMQLPQRKLSELASTGILKVTRDADGRPSYSTEVRLKSKEDDYRWHLVRVLLAQRANKDDSEEETWYGTCTDIDDHKALERDLKETMDEKSRFLSNMSHEIRTPLNGITGMVNFLIDSNLTVEQMEHVNIIRASTEGLRGLINDILDLSKAEAGMIQLNLDWLYVRALIEEVNDLTSAMAIDKGLELNYLVDEDVPAQIKGDRFRLRQILLNIVGNAIKFTQQGEVFVHCKVFEDEDEELKTDEMFIKFDVIDTGQGFTEKEAEYLFKRFSQIDGSSTRQHGGSGLGLVISQQLAQLHGGDMGAKGVPGKGSTFSFYVKATLPSGTDRPPAPAATPEFITTIAHNPTSFGIELTKTTSGPTDSQAIFKTALRAASQAVTSPGRYSLPDPDKDSPSMSSASSDPSIRSALRTSSMQSERSSVSSFTPETHQAIPLQLVLPSDGRKDGAKPPQATSNITGTENRPISTLVRTVTNEGMPTPSIAAMPAMYSILVVAPLKHSRTATMQHISQTVPKSIPHQITAREEFAECQRMLGGDEPVKFTHVVVVLQNAGEIVLLLDQVLGSPAQQKTTVVIITDLGQRRNIIEHSSKHDWDKLQSEGRVLFVFKPLKPSRFAIIFDPQKEREMSTDHNQDSAQQVAVSQKQVFDELSRRIGNRDKRVLLVEDNRVNQMVILKFFAKVSIKVDTALDGVQCTEKVFSHPPGYYSIILCDLHMPNKDGYQTCKEIRQWELAKRVRSQPVIALSANVLGDVYEKCVEAGFNSYMTKPVDFKELSAVLMAFMDPSDPDKPLELLRSKTSKSRPRTNA